MRGACRMGQECSDVAKTDGSCAEHHVVHQVNTRIIATFELEDDDTTTTTDHLPPGEIGLRMIRVPGVANPRDLCVVAQPLCYLKGVLVMAFHTQGQRRDAAGDEPGIERTDTASKPSDWSFLDPLDHGCGSHHSASDRVTVATEEFGGRVHNDVYAQLDGALVDWGGKGVVNDRQNVVRPGDLANCGEVVHHQGWVAR